MFYTYSTKRITYPGVKKKFILKSKYEYICVIFQNINYQFY